MIETRAALRLPAMASGPPSLLLSRKLSVRAFTACSALIAAAAATAVPIANQIRLTNACESGDNASDGRSLQLVWYIVIGQFRSQAALQAEVLVLRHLLLTQASNRAPARHRSQLAPGSARRRILGEPAPVSCRSVPSACVCASALRRQIPRRRPDILWISAGTPCRPPNRNFADWRESSARPP